MLMMEIKKITRENVFKLMAKCRLFFCSKDQIIELLEDYGVDVNADDEYIEEKLFDSLVCMYQGVSNGYLSEFYEGITGEKVEVVGEVVDLFSCPCCGYKTLAERCNPEEGTGYDICVYCNWEDDGTENIDVATSINKGSMKDYRNRIQQNPNFYYREKWGREPGRTKE